MFAELSLYLPEALGYVLAQSPPLDQTLDPGVVNGGAGPIGNLHENLIPIVAIVMGCTVAIVAIVSSVVSSAHKEKTRREIAAYVAEGSINPDDGERLMRAASTEGKK